MQKFGKQKIERQLVENRGDKAKSRRTVKAAQTNYKHPLGKNGKKKKLFHMLRLPAKCKSISQNIYSHPLRTLLILFL